MLCIWYFHFEYWLNSIHFIWLYFANSYCVSSKLWFSLRLRSRCRLLSFEDNKSDYHSQSYFKCISFSFSPLLAVWLLAKLLQNILSYKQNWIIIVIHSHENREENIRAKLANSMRVLFKHVQINQWIGDNRNSCKKLGNCDKSKQTCIVFYLVFRAFRELLMLRLSSVFSRKHVVKQPRNNKPLTASLTSTALGNSINYRANNIIRFNY